MNIRKFATGTGIPLALALLLVTLALAFSPPNPGARAQGAEAPNAVAWDTDGNSVTDVDFLGTTNKKPLVFKTKNQERMRIHKKGNVGINTNNPRQQLEVNGIVSMGAPGGIYGYLFDAGAQGLYPTLGFNTYGAPSYNAGATGFGGVFQFHNEDGDLRYYSGSNVTAGQPHTFTERLVIKNNGDVGIGTTTPSGTFDIQGNGANQVLRVTRSTGEVALRAYDDGTVEFGQFYLPSSTGHLCYFHVSNKALTSCSSAAEYVPTIDGGNGFPETADLVSIAPEANNPYADKHSPFVVHKSATACDSNLLGFIVNPESGADGEKRNNSYLPLAIYGYFPAKVTLENGRIKRGDPITSSSMPGYGMKATGPCKIIGYALEDANVEGTIQVFAHLSDNTLPLVNALVQENRALRQQLVAIEARVEALEEGSPLIRRTTAHVSPPK